MGSFIDNSGDINLDAELTDQGRQRLAREDAEVSQRQFDLQDEEIDVSAMERQPENEKVERKPVEPTEGEASQRKVGLHGEDSNDEPDPRIVGRSNYVEQPEESNTGKFEWSEGGFDSDSVSFFDDDDASSSATYVPMPEPDLSEHFDEIGETEGISLEPIADVLEKSNTIDSDEGDLIAISDPSVTDTTADVAFYDPAPITVDLEESADEDDWEEPEDRLDKGDRDDEEEDDDEED